MPKRLTLGEGQLDVLEGLFSAYDSENRANGIVHQYKLPEGNITIWRTGTLLIQGKKEETLLQKVSSVIGDTSKFVNEGQIYQGEPSQAYIIGTDEVGNGSYTGGMTAAAVYVSPEAVSKLQQLGVTDSKNISDKRIPELAETIRSLCPHYEWSSNAKEYNDAIAKGLNQVSMKTRMHDFCFRKLVSNNPDLKVDRHIVDGFTSQASYMGYLENYSRKVRPELITKAESQYLAVAAASVLARDLFLRQIENISLYVGFPVHQGVTSYVREDVTRAVSMGFDLSYIGKLHFKNTKDWGLG